jgi:hypothetical protein
LGWPLCAGRLVGRVSGKPSQAKQAKFTFSTTLAKAKQRRSPLDSCPALALITACNHNVTVLLVQNHFPSLGQNHPFRFLSTDCRHVQPTADSDHTRLLLPPVSLQQMVLFGQNPSQGTLLKASQFLAGAHTTHETARNANTPPSISPEELPVRLAHRVRELDDLPQGLSDMPSIRRVKEWYAQSFEVSMITTGSALVSQSPDHFYPYPVHKLSDDVRATVMSRTQSCPMTQSFAASSARESGRAGEQPAGSQDPRPLFLTDPRAFYFTEPDISADHFGLGTSPSAHPKQTPRSTQTALLHALSAVSPPSLPPSRRDPFH